MGLFQCQAISMDFKHVKNISETMQDVNVVPTTATMWQRTDTK